MRKSINLEHTSYPQPLELQYENLADNTTSSLIHLKVTYPVLERISRFVSFFGISDTYFTDV